jgi:hypothetical protein
MTPAERQTRRRGIQEALQITDATGKSREEAASGGFGSTKLDTLAVQENDEGNGTIGWRRVAPRPMSDDRQSLHAVHVRGLRIGDEDSNRRLFAENELRKMVEEYFASPTVSPLAHWVSRQVSNVAVQQSSPSLTLTCKACGDAMESVGDAADHLRTDHQDLICGWFGRLHPPREFRDMQSYVTVAMPRRRKGLQEQALMSD